MAGRAWQRARDFGWAVRAAWKYGRTPPQGRVYVPERMYDTFRTHYADGLSFATLRTLLRAAEGGDLATTLQLFEDIESKDLHLAGVAENRRDALTGLEWQITSLAEMQAEQVDKTLADEAAACARETLAELPGFEAALEHLASAVGTNLAIAELVWERCELREILPIPSWRLTAEVFAPDKPKIITREKPRGVAAEGAKFIVHVPRKRPGCPLTGSTCYKGAPLFLIKLLAVADWAKFCEVYGMPIRWGTYAPGATTEEKEEALEMLESMGSAAYALFSEAVQMELKESSQRGTAPYKDIVEWCERKQSIAWLGQHLTTETTGGTGTYAAASVHQDVREDKLRDDIRRESRTVCEQLIAPLVAYKFPGQEVPVPIFERILPEVRDEAKEAAKFMQAQQIGVAIPRRHGYDRLGIPEPEEGEEVLTPSIAAEADMLMEGV